MTPPPQGNIGTPSSTNSDLAAATQRLMAQNIRQLSASRKTLQTPRGVTPIGSLLPKYPNFQTPDQPTTSLPQAYTSKDVDAMRKGPTFTAHDREISASHRASLGADSAAKISNTNKVYGQ